MPEKEPRTLTEDEAYAIVADRVAKETAELTKKNADLMASNTDLQNKLDTAEAALVAEKAAKETAEKAFETYKTEEAAKREQAALADTRVEAIKTANPALKDDKDFFTPERAARWAKMDQTDFDDLLAQFGRFATKPGEAPKDDKGARETAMLGSPPKDPGTDTTSAGRGFLTAIQGG